MCNPCLDHLCYLCLGTAQEPRPTKSVAHSPIRRFACLPPSVRPLVSGRIPLLPGYAILALYPGSNYPVRILGKFVYLIQGQPEMICH
jgi:hypothetical protein